MRSSYVVPFPEKLPDGYALIPESVRFDADIHLQLEHPDKIWTLEDFGYTQAQIRQCASSVAVTSPFRLLSDAGVKALHHVATNLESVCSKIDGNRTPKHLAGGVYRSRFLRDLCACPFILQHMSEISGTELFAHSMPSQQIYINYAPQDIEKAVDAWHYDGIGFDYVVMVSDPSTLLGGNFEYFCGTRDEIADLFGLPINDVRYGITEPLPADRTIQVSFPAAGYAIFQQGNMVVHRATKLLSAAERITAVPGLVSNRTDLPDATAIHDMSHYGEPGIQDELAVHCQWMKQSR